MQISSKEKSQGCSWKKGHNEFLVFLNYQVDEYLESVAGPQFSGRLLDKGYYSQLEVSGPLEGLISHVLQLPTIANASLLHRSDNAKYTSRDQVISFTEETTEFFNWSYSYFVPICVCSSVLSALIISLPKGATAL